MSWFKKLTKYLPGAMAVGAASKAMSPKGEGDYRGEAAGGLIRRDVKRQAGSGQIKFTEERQA